MNFNLKSTHPNLIKSYTYIRLIH
uniref:Uncharacterized protein n=1 Tax=Anguilla anguilla TaxID=7936 RepID=A0A0E9VNY5_ANGAN